MGSGIGNFDQIYDTVVAFENEVWLRRFFFLSLDSHSSI